EPEDMHAVEHLDGAGDERVVVEARIADHVLDLVVGMPCVIAFEPRVPDEKADVERGEAAPRGVAPPAFDELVPEARRGPVLDRPRRGGRGRIVLVAVKPD